MLISVKLIGKVILKTIPSEDELGELSFVESMYMIRRLKAVIDSDGEYIEVRDLDNGIIFSDKYKIGFNENEYIKK